MTNLEFLKTMEWDKEQKEAFGVGVDFPDSYPCGSEVLKTNSEPGDNTPNGTRGIVVGCRDVSNIDNPEARFPIKYAYIVIFLDKIEGLPNPEDQSYITFLVDYKLKPKE